MGYSRTNDWSLLDFSGEPTPGSTQMIYYVESKYKEHAYTLNGAAKSMKTAFTATSGLTGKYASALEQKTSQISSSFSKMAADRSSDQHVETSLGPSCSIQASVAEQGVRHS